MLTRCGGRLRLIRCGGCRSAGWAETTKGRPFRVSLCLWVVLLREVAVPCRFVGFRFVVPF